MSVDKVFEALSSAPRRRILAYLSKTDMTAGEITRRFSDMMSQPAISKHLSILENAVEELAFVGDGPELTQIALERIG